MNHIKEFALNQKWKKAGYIASIVDNRWTEIIKEWKKIRARERQKKKKKKRS